MAEEPAQRRLAAILAADVVGYSRLMGANEVGTLAGLKAHRKELVDGKIATLTLGESKLPCIADVPPLKTVLVESPTGPTPFGGKAIAENPNVPTAAAIANAIADACGVRLDTMPFTPERVLRGLDELRG